MNNKIEQVIGAIFIWTFAFLTYYLYDNFIREVLVINANYIGGFMVFVFVYEFWRFVFGTFWDE